ncbi:hypothetical protein B0H11DRAFT_1030612 [Mycena galericulata]|nr:hypothetical protein B0H11DRAFT_1030612 [Mycena galericulata]
MKPRSPSPFYGPDLSCHCMRHHCSRGFKPQMSLFAWLVPSHPMFRGVPHHIFELLHLQCARKLRVACGACSVPRTFLIAQHSITGLRHSVFPNLTGPWKCTWSSSLYSIWTDARTGFLTPAHRLGRGSGGVIVTQLCRGLGSRHHQSESRARVRGCFFAVLGFGWPGP